jgi:hypothetical protein
VGVAGAKFDRPLSARENPKEYSRTPYSGRKLSGSQRADCFRRKRTTTSTDWKPADEKGDEAQLLPPLRNGETAQLHDPKIEDKETRPPPRYNEGTLIEAMQNAWALLTMWFCGSA